MVWGGSGEAVAVAVGRWKSVGTPTGPDQARRQMGHTDQPVGSHRRPELI